jgi:starvation-inducible DNA-binding protein
MMRMKPNIGISEEARGAMAEGLGRLLSDTYTLYLKTHRYHWNVEGPMFQALHQMFMVQYTELWNAVDLIAERIRALGEYAPGTYKAFVELSSIDDDEGDVPPSAMEMVRNLMEGHEQVAATARNVFETAEAANDQVSCDLLTQRMEVSEKTAWMLRAMQQ